MSTTERLRLCPRLWVPLTGSDRQVMLHGKRHDGSDGIDLHRTGGGPPEWGGWDLTPVLGHCFIRRAP